MEGSMNKVGRILPLLVALLLFVQQCTAAKTCYSGDRDALLAFKARKCRLMVQKKKTIKLYWSVHPAFLIYSAHFVTCNN